MNQKLNIDSEQLQLKECVTNTLKATKNFVIYT